MGDDGGVSRWPHMVASLYPSAGVATHPACQEVPSAFGGFGIGKTTFAEEYGVSSKEGKFAGCRACRLHLSPHCAMPHLECAAHALPPDISPQLHSSSFLGLTGYTQGTPEVCALIKVNCVRLSSLEGKETYPVGEGDDWVISKESLQTEITKLRPVSSTENGLSVLIDVSNISECADIAPDGDWRNWPYLTTEAIEYLLSSDTTLSPPSSSSHRGFQHIRLFLPSLERADSQGGMWNHCRWFGLPPDRSAEETRAHVEAHRALPARQRPWQRTVGEFFSRPPQMEGLEGSAWYALLCPIVDFAGLDFAITCPMLYALSS